jgi:hypothetical protein
MGHTLVRGDTLKELLRRLNPAVPSSVLPVLAGLTWGAVGVMLLSRSLGWFMPADRNGAFWIALVVGVIMAAGMIPGMFRKIVTKNLTRLSERPDRACIFSVFAWRSWLMVAVMSIGGVLLRQSGVPRLALAGPYLGMGLCLLSGSVRYFHHVYLESR